MTFVGFAVAAVLLAFLCSYFIRNTSGVHPTNQPGALAGNLAMLFVALVVGGIVVLAVIGITR